jgi:hypothetical protein
MRAHTKLTPSQIDCNAAFAAAHPAVRAAFRMSGPDAVEHLRAAGFYAQPWKGWASILPNAMDLVRDLESIKRRATPQRDVQAPRGMRRKRTDTPLGPLDRPRRAIWRIPADRSAMVREAAPSGRDSANLRHNIKLADRGEEPSYSAEILQDGSKRWIHRIRLPRDWMTRVAPAFNNRSYRPGSLGFGEFVLDAHLVGDEGFDGSRTYKVTRVRASRGFTVKIDIVYVRWWAPHDFSVHKTLKAADVAPMPEWFAEKRARAAVMFEVDMGVIRSMAYSD